LPDKKYAAVDKALQRLFKADKILKIQRGFYKYREKKQKLEEILGEDKILVHWLKLIGRKNEGGPTIQTSDKSALIGSVTAGRVEHLRDLVGGQPTLKFWLQEGNKNVLKTVWRGRPLRVEESPATVEVSLACSERALSIPLLDAYLSFLEGFFYPFDFYAVDWYKMNIALNIDSYDVRIDGATAIKISDLKGEIRRWYVKRGFGGDSFVRREVHATTDFPISELVANLRGETPVGMNVLLSRIGELEGDQVQIRKLLRENAGWSRKLVDEIVGLTAVLERYEIPKSIVRF